MRGPQSGASRLADDTRRRFVAAIVAHVPLDRIVELYLFPPMRQGGVETGVAVVASRPADADGARHTVFMARYRLTIRGPERGTWDADVVEEADAPLVTVEAVVRGVQRRAGDAADAERLGAEAVRRLLGAA